MRFAFQFDVSENYSMTKLIDSEVLKVLKNSCIIKTIQYTDKISFYQTEYLLSELEVITMYKESIQKVKYFEKELCGTNLTYQNL